MKGSLFAFAVGLLAMTVSAQAGPLYGTLGYGGTSSTLVELDPDTGALIRTIGPVGYGINGLTYDATTGTLYGASRYADPNFNGLLVIDIATGAGTPAGAQYWGMGSPLAITNITVDSAGRMYGWSEWCDCLVRIDKSTGVATQVGASGVGTMEYGLSFDNSDVLHLVNYDGNVYRVDTTSGWATWESSIGQHAHHGDFDPLTGLYYGLTYGTPRTLLRCDLGTGSCTGIAEVGDLHTLAFVDTEVEPCTGFEISTDLTSGDDTPAPGDSGCWTFRVGVRACEDATGVYAQGGTSGWTELASSTPSTGSVTFKKTGGKSSTAVLRWIIGDMLAGDAEAMDVTVCGKIKSSAACDSIQYLNGQWSATYSLDEGLTYEQTDYTEPLFVTVTCE